MLNGNVTALNRATGITATNARVIIDCMVEVIPKDAVELEVVCGSDTFKKWCINLLNDSIYFYERDNNCAIIPKTNIPIIGSTKLTGSDEIYIESNGSRIIEFNLIP